MIKNIKYLLSFVILAMVGLVSCDNEYAQPPLILPEGGIGTGAWDNPMTVYQARIGSVNEDTATNPTAPLAWVKGYIVGVVNTEVGNTLNERCAQFEGPFSVNTNLLISMDSVINDPAVDWEKCATVQLPSGPVRSALNLKDNPGNIGKMVCIYGTTGEKYCGAYGVRSCTDFNWGEIGNPPVVIEPAEPISAPVYENFEGSASVKDYVAQGWRNTTVSGGLDGWYIKTFDNNNYITVSAYLGNATGGPYENWLITPPINVDQLSDKSIQFITQAAYPADNCTLEVYVMTSDDPTNSTNTKLEANIAVPPTSGFSSWADSGKLSLAEYTGTIYVGWRYYSAKGGSGNSATYCVDNVSIGGGTEADLPAQPGSDSIYEALSSNADGWTFENTLMPESASRIWYWDSNQNYLKASAFISNTNYAAESYAISPAISLAGVTGATVSFSHAARFQTTLKDLCKLVVREKGATEWTEFSIPKWPNAGKWEFAESGNINIAAFDGKEIEIAFKYASSEAGADTWEVKNLKVTGSK